MIVNVIYSAESDATLSSAKLGLVYIEIKGQGPELQCLLKVKEDLS